MLKILAGDWSAGKYVAVSSPIFGGPKTLLMPKGVFTHERISVEDVESAEILTQENYSSAAGKVGWGAAGAVALGPIGLLAGAIIGGNRNAITVIVRFKDGRSVMIQGKSKGNYSVDSLKSVDSLRVKG